MVPTFPRGRSHLRRVVAADVSGSEPLRERLTLFWHNHFATSIAKIADAGLMQRQIDLIRKHALGKFGRFFRGNRVVMRPC